jgi:phosphatidylserine/phosphatidylglycerophosphate/cardiolipin synthase-like enzyme
VQGLTAEGVLGVLPKARIVALGRDLDVALSASVTLNERSKELLEGFNGWTRTITLALDIAVAERVHRPPPHLKLVWTGPESQGATARDTAMLVTELFENARKEVLIAGFRFDDGVDIFAPLHRVMVEHGVRTTVFIDIDIPGEAKTVAGADEYARRAVEIFLCENWPFGEPRPAVYYDPRTALPGPPWVSLHAKCVVVDERLTFVTSANFTDRGQTPNVELGVLIEDGGFARNVAAQWLNGLSKQSASTAS